MRITRLINQVGLLAILAAYYGGLAYFGILIYNKIGQVEWWKLLFGGLLEIILIVLGVIIAVNFLTRHPED